MSGSVSVAPRYLATGPHPTEATPQYEKPLFNLHSVSRTPIRIASIALLRNSGRYFVRSRSTDGATGIAMTKQIEDFIPILLRRVADRPAN